MDRAPTSWTIARAVGAPVVITPSWLIGALIMAALFANSYAAVLPTRSAAYLTAAGAAAILLISVFVHELAHAVVGKALGRRILRIELTLWGGQTLSEGGTTAPLPSAVMSAAGPAANLVIAGAGWLVMRADGFHGLPLPAQLLIFSATWVNLLLGLFNLIPGLPMDGGFVLESLIWRATGSRERGTLIAARVGQVVAIALVVITIGWPMLRGDSPSLISVIWVAMIASVLWQGATGSISHARFRSAVDAFDASTLLRPVILVPATATVAQATQLIGQWLTNQAGAESPRSDRQPIGLIIDGGVIRAIVDPGALAHVPAAAAADVPVQAVAAALGPVPVVEWSGGGAATTLALARACSQSPVAIVTMRVPGGQPLTQAVLADDLQAAFAASGLQ